MTSHDCPKNKKHLTWNSLRKEYQDKVYCVECGEYIE